MNHTKILACLIASMVSLYTLAKTEETFDPAKYIFANTCKVAEKEKIISKIKTEIQFVKQAKESEFEHLKMGNTLNNQIFYENLLELYQKCLWEAETTQSQKKINALNASSCAILKEVSK